MKRTYYKHEDFDTKKPFVRFVDDTYDYNYANIDKDGYQLDGGYFKITEEEAQQLEELPEYKGVR